jgi:hypothetical protein
MDPRIRIRIHAKMSWIRNTAYYFFLLIVLLWKYTSEINPSFANLGFSIEGELVGRLAVRHLVDLEPFHRGLGQRQ